MTDGAMLTEILAALEIPCDKCSFHGKLDALAAGLGISTEGRLLGDVLDDIAAKEGIQRDNRLYGAFIRKLYDYVTNGEDVTLTGNPLVLANSMGRPLKECVVSWEPTQEGEGTPSPDNIWPIHGRDSVQVERCGENLVNTQGLNYVGWATTYQELIDELNKLPIGVYALRCMMTIDSFSDRFTSNTAAASAFMLRVYAKNGKGIITIPSSQVTKQTLLPLTKALTAVFSITEENVGKIERCYCYSCGRDTAVEGAPNGRLGTGRIYDVCIVSSSTAPVTYSPYSGSTTNLTLPNTVYGGEVDAVTGEGQETWKLLTLDGTENWNTWGVNANNSAVTGFYTYDINDYDAENVKGICSNLPHSDADTWGGRNSGIGFATVGSSRYFMYCVPTVILADISDKTAAIASLKAFLAAQYAAGTPVQIAYKLNTPVQFQTTGCGTIPTVKGTNTLLTDADTIKATYRCNVRAAEQELDALYTDLLQELEE